jgi:hypothetical protein
MENQIKGDKNIMLGLCPHCSKEVMVTVATTSPQLLSIHKIEDFDKAKEKVLGILEKVTFESAEYKELALNYVKVTPFGPAEVDAVLAIVLPHTLKTEETK